MLSRVYSWGLKDAVVGSLVRVDEGGWHASWQVRQVTKVTKTKVTLSDGSEWTRKGGRWGLSSDLSTPHAKLILDEAAAKKERAEYLAERALERQRREVETTVSAKWRELTKEQCETILAALSASAPSERGE